MGRFTHKVRILIGICSLMLLASCGPQSMEDYREEGREVMKSLTEELASIRTRGDLQQASQKLKNKFNDLVDTMIHARDFYESHPHAEMLDLEPIDHSLSLKLKSELERIYRIEGGRKLVEKYQEDALNRLDAYEKKAEKNKLKL